MGAKKRGRSIRPRRNNRLTSVQNWVSPEIFFSPSESWVVASPLSIKTGKKSTTLTTNVLLRCVFRRRHALLEAMVALMAVQGAGVAGKASITVEVNWAKGHPIDVDGASIAAKAVIDAMVRRGYLRGDGPKDVVEVRFVAGSACETPWIRVSAADVTPKL